MAEGEAREGPPAGTVLGARPLRDEASEEEALRGMVADFIVEAFAWVGPALGREAKARLRGGDAGRPTSLWWSTIAAPSREGVKRLLSVLQGRRRDLHYLSLPHG